MRGSLFLLVLIAGCAGGASPAPPPPPDDPASLNPKTPRRGGEIIAWLDRRPVTRGKLLDATLEMDYKGTVDRYIFRVLVERRKRALGIDHSPEELRRRATRRVQRLKESAGPAVFDTNLSRAGITEAEFINKWSRDKGLATLLGNEKAAVYELLAGGHTRVDIAVLESLEEADRYHKDTTSVRPREVLRNIRMSRTLYPTLMRPDLVETIVAADPTDPAQRYVRAALATGTGAVHVTLHERVPGLGGDYTKIKGDVIDDILLHPPDTHELEMWIQHLFLKAEVKYDDRWYPPRD